MVQGLNSGGNRFSTLALRPTQIPVNGNKVSLPGVKQLGHGVDHPPPSNVEVKEREQLYPYSPCGSFFGELNSALQ